MASHLDSESAPRSPERILLRRRAGQIVLQFGVLIALLFGAAGTLRWSWAWVYTAAVALLTLANAFVIPAEVAAERAQPQPNVKQWDKRIVNSILLLTLIVFTTAGLDYRLGWTSRFSPLWHWLGLAGVTLASLLFMWAMHSNRFFSTRVRIQEERGHTAVSTGPYRWVRHPGYSALIVSNLATPLLLGSLLALLPALAIAALYVLRTALEDRTLHAELPGYAAFARQTPHRLLPGIW